MHVGQRAGAIVPRVVRLQTDELTQGQQDDHSDMNALRWQMIVVMPVLDPNQSQILREHHLWQRGQRWVPRPPTAIRSMDA